MQKRPLIITISCLFNFFIISINTAVFLFPTFRVQLINQYGNNFIPCFIFGLLILFIASFAYWRMKRFGIFIYLGIIIVSILLSIKFNLNDYLIVSIFPQVINLALGVKYLDKMT